MRFPNYLFLLLLSSLFLQVATAQEATSFSFEKAEQDLTELAHSVVNDSLLEDRQNAYRVFETLLLSTLEQANSFDYPFEDLQSVSIQMPLDRTFRIFTWQLFVDNNTYQYGGLIQRNAEEASLFPLKDNSQEIAVYDIEYLDLSPEEWYGAIYYNIQTFDTLDQKKYLLFGYDGFEFFNKRKVAEVLSFDETGTPIFGAPVFSKEVEGYPANIQNRLFIEYASEVAARLNYDASLSIIIYDHLIQMKSPYRGQGMTNVPDGSYEGFYFEEGIWKYKEKIFDFISETPPQGKSILGANRKTLFGGREKY